MPGPERVRGRADITAPDAMITMTTHVHLHDKRLLDIARMVGNGTLDLSDTTQRTRGTWGSNPACQPVDRFRPRPRCSCLPASRRDQAAYFLLDVDVLPGASGSRSPRHVAGSARPS